jgi:hypothetical protein
MPKILFYFNIFFCKKSKIYGLHIMLDVERFACMRQLPLKLDIWHGLPQPGRPLEDVGRDRKKKKILIIIIKICAKTIYLQIG